MTQPDSLPTASDFLREAINEDLTNGRYQQVQTRFPPEPNGYLHIGHAKAVCINFGIAKDYGGRCNLRFDDTNPVKEEVEYVEAIKQDIRWLGFDWGEQVLYASDYFEQLYQYARLLIQKGNAYVDDLSAEEIRAYRGTLTEAGKDSPYRNRSIEENLDLFERMRQGEFPDGSRVLRAKIDMASSNMNLRDPVMYRILHAEHHRSGNQWSIYPMYDFAHGQSDSIEHISHSLCSLEFQDHRPLYDWFIKELGIFHPRQIEFSRLNLSYTVLSKRKLIRLVKEKHVSGWDDPRMPTLSGMRRRGYPAAAVVDFCDKIGIAKSENLVDIALLEHCVRQELNRTAPRMMGVLNPVKVVLVNYPEDLVEEMQAINNPEDPSMGSRLLPFSRELYIEADDFREVPPPKYYRLSPGREVRLRYGYFVKCLDVKKDAAGNILEIHCTYDPETRGGDAPDGRKVKSTIHWVSARHALKAKVRLYDRLFMKEKPEETEEGDDFLSNINPDSLQVLEQCFVEPNLAGAKAGSTYQFERQGYFCVDPDTDGQTLIFNRTVALRDTWAKIEARQ